MSPWGKDLVRVGIILAATSAVAFCTNALAERPVPVLHDDGPGALSGRERRMTVGDLEREWRKGRALVLLDVRTAGDYQRGHARQSLHAPAPEFIKHYSRLGLSSVLRAASGIVVMCGSDACSYADNVAKELRTLGHPEVWVLSGGWDAYQASGLEDVER